MSRRNCVCPACGAKGRAECLGGPPCWGVWLPPKCKCGVMMVQVEAPKKNRKQRKNEPTNIRR